MDYYGLRLAQTLCLKDPDLFQPYFKQMRETHHERHAEAEAMYKTFDYPADFDCFLANYREYRKKTSFKTLKEALAAEEGVAPEPQRDPEPDLSRQDLSRQDLSYRWQPLAHRFQPHQEPSTTITVVPPSRKRRRHDQQSLDVAEFLREQRQNGEHWPLKFLPNEEVQEILPETDTRARMYGQMHILANQVERLNDHCAYTLLHIVYEA